MAPLKIALVGLLGVGIAASLVFADHKPNHPGGGDTGGVTGTWVFAGYTTATTTGDATLPVIYDMCQFEFGPDARMALTEEWIKSPNITLPIADAWIQPIPTKPLDDIFYNDSSGNCGGWTSPGDQGVAIFVEGYIGERACNVSRPVACVVPQ